VETGFVQIKEKENDAEEAIRRVKIGNEDLWQKSNTNLKVATKQYSPCFGIFMAETVWSIFLRPITLR
jgi:hypothetical protein